jgi:hypothetical protein
LARALTEPFYLELTVMEALSYARGTLSQNVL